MKKLILLGMFALGTITASASNCFEFKNVDKCDQVFRVNYRIEVSGLVYPGNWGFPTRQVFYTETGFFTATELEARKTYLLSLYTDTYTTPGGSGIKYSVHHSNVPIGGL